MSFPEKTIAQTEALLKIQVRLRVRKPSSGLIILAGLHPDNPAWAVAWRKFAIDYLTAKAEGRKMRDLDAERDAEFWGENAGKRNEDDPRSTH